MPNSNRGACGFQSNEFENQSDRPSKTQLKREMTALQKLGAELIEQSRDRLKNVPMPENLREEILRCQQTKTHEGRRRQLQYVGKVMRQLEQDEITAIQKVVDSWRGVSKAATAALHALEHYRLELLRDESVFRDLLLKHPDLDTQHWRTLIRNARKEQTEAKPAKAYREIFQLLKQLPEFGGNNGLAGAKRQDTPDDDPAFSEDE